MSDIDEGTPTDEESAAILELENLIRGKDKAKAAAEESRALPGTPD